MTVLVVVAVVLLLIVVGSIKRPYHRAVPRSIATNTIVDRPGLLDFVRPRHKVVLGTHRGDGSTQLSPVTAGVHGDGRVLVSCSASGSA